MSEKIRFAVIGTSSVAPAHIKALQSNPNAEVVYIHSRNINRSSEFAEQFRLTPTKSYEDILGDNTIDAVDIVTEPNRHANLALEAIKHGKHVLIEKPLDIDLNLAKKVINESSKVSTVTEYSFSTV